MEASSLHLCYTAAFSCNNMLEDASLQEMQRFYATANIHSDTRVHAFMTSTNTEQRASEALEEHFVTQRFKGLELISHEFPAEFLLKQHFECVLKGRGLTANAVNKQWRVLTRLSASTAQ